MRNPRARGRRGGGSVGGVSRGGAPPVGQSQVLKIRDGILKTNYCSCGLGPNYFPPPTNLDNLYNFFPTSKFKMGKSV